MKRASLRTYLLLSLIASAFLGVIVYFPTQSIEETLIASGITFIVTVVVIATLDLSAKEDSTDPDKPRLK
jgi:VIT1/CCC1 family predicted Fe2+/Mn2+ transporter